jgi:hypothetical protein
MPVASLILLVTAAAMANEIYGSEKWRYVEGISPPVEGNGLALSTGRIGCS